MESLVIVIGTIVIFIIALFYSSLSWGYVTWKFWYWFILPVFPMLPALTFVQAVGIMFFINLFKTLPSQIIKKEYVDEMNAGVVAMLAPWLTLLLGWIIKLVFNI